MKPLTPFRQTPGLCGPASLKILLSHYGMDMSESELAVLCDATPERGTDHSSLINAMRSLGVAVISKEDAAIDDIRRSLDVDAPVIVGWWSGDGDHFSVAYDLEGDDISLMDPELDIGMRRMPVSEFEALWYDLDGSDDRPVRHWMMRAGRG